MALNLIYAKDRFLKRKQAKIIGPANTNEEEQGEVDLLHDIEYSLHG